ncbi:L-lactate transport (plasmid) [Gemmatirosa kalamazoonensis]|uniref:L-lactate permease n=1 Tax=Gemmatirosa kalamazoonensis TaxID=861299 RepID=W0RTG4_9BACT|nr:L-lactate permease [Gemmatirosa kalamazoonensis]AHG93732.1 L-lactate transport [Gemmatirosa kalamazoonensis]
MPWTQSYDPLGSPLLSTLAAALPLVALLGLLAMHRVRAHVAALVGLAAALAVAVLVVGMPPALAARSALLGAAYGLFPIGWIVLNVMFLYQLADGRGSFGVLRQLVTGVTDDRRLQLLVIAFAFGAFFEGAAGFGTPVAVTAALLIGLGFAPLEASALSLIANTAPVAFGALGTPIVALQGVTGIDARVLSAMVGRQLPLFSVIVPVWLVWAYAGRRGVLPVWPAVLVAGVAFAVPQFLVSNFHGPWLVDVVAAVCSMVATIVFLRFWRPGFDEGRQWRSHAPQEAAPSRGDVVRALLPWAVLTVLVFAWGTPQVKDALNALSAPKLAVPGLDKMVLRGPPVVAAPSAEAAVFTLNWLSATGTAILVAGIVSGIALGYSLGEMVRAYWRTIVLVRHSLLTIAAMLALGYTSRYAGLDAILGLAFARTGVLYPFFGAMLGWLGVALTGSDTSSNVLFGNLQTITARQLNVSPVLMAAANSSGGVMGKMIDAQSIVVASTATRWYGHEGKILRYVFFHSIALAALVGILVTLQAYVPPFTALVVR